MRPMAAPRCSQRAWGRAWRPRIAAFGRPVADAAHFIDFQVSEYLRNKSRKETRLRPVQCGSVKETWFRLAQWVLWSPRGRFGLSVNLQPLASILDSSWPRFGLVLLARSAHPAIPLFARRKRANSLGSIFSVSAYSRARVQRLRIRKSG